MSFSYSSIVCFPITVYECGNKTISTKSSKIGQLLVGFSPLLFFNWGFVKGHNILVVESHHRSLLLVRPKSSIQNVRLGTTE